jgi:parvulin-like peptidyl-prolyl isomerase
MASESKRTRSTAGMNRTPARRSRGGLSDLLGMDSERQARILLIGSVIGVLLIVAGIIAAGWYYSIYKPRHRTVLEADGIKVDYQAMKRRMKFEYFQSVTFQRNFQVLPETTYLNLLNELTLISRAESELGITASDEEISERLRSRIGVPADADEKTFGDRYRTTLEASGLKDKEYRRLVEAEVLQGKIQDKFRAEAPAVVLQSKVEVIAADSEEEARSAIARIRAGEDFGTVARAVSNESDVATTGGVKEFGPRGAFNAAYDDFAFNANIGDISEPLEGAGSSVYVVRVIDRQDLPLTEEQKPSYVNRLYGDWLTTTQAKMTIERDWDEEAQTDALISVLQDIPPQDPAQQVPVQQQPQAPAPEAPAPDAAAPDTGAPDAPAPEAPASDDAAPDAPADGQ